MVSEDPIQVASGLQLLGALFQSEEEAERATFPDGDRPELAAVVFPLLDRPDYAKEVARLACIFTETGSKDPSVWFVQTGAIQSVFNLLLFSDDPQTTGYALEVVANIIVDDPSVSAHVPDEFIGRCFWAMGSDDELVRGRGAWALSKISDGGVPDEGTCISIVRDAYAFSIGHIRGNTGFVEDSVNYAMRTVVNVTTESTAAKTEAMIVGWGDLALSFLYYDRPGFAVWCIALLGNLTCGVPDIAEAFIEKGAVGVISNWARESVDPKTRKMAVWFLGNAAFVGGVDDPGAATQGVDGAAAVVACGGVKAILGAVVSKWNNLAIAGIYALSQLFSAMPSATLMDEIYGDGAISSTLVLTLSGIACRNAQARVQALVAIDLLVSAGREVSDSRGCEDNAASNLFCHPEQIQLDLDGVYNDPAATRRAREIIDGIRKEIASLGDGDEYGEGW